MKTAKRSVFLDNERDYDSIMKQWRELIRLSKERNVPIIVGGNIEMLSKAIGKNNKAIIGIENVNLSNEIQKINNGGGTIG